MSEPIPDPDDIKDVLFVIKVNESVDCDIPLIDRDTGLDSFTVDTVVEYLWRTNQIEGIPVPGMRWPNLVGMLRVVKGRPRLWGEEGEWRSGSE